MEEKEKGVKTRYVQGQSGNPLGRPKGSRNHKTIMRELFDSQVVVYDKNQKKTVITREEQIILELYNLAMHSERDGVRLSAIKELMDRMYGKSVPVMPEPPENDEEGVVFYFPNEHSRSKK